MGQGISLLPPMSEPQPSESVTVPRAALFARGATHSLRSVFAYVLFGTYVGYGALAHDLGFSVLWTFLSTLLIWAAPAQVILVSALGAGASPIEAAVGVGLSGVRLLPMVVALLPMLKGAGARQRDLLVPAHFTAVSMWIEAFRLLPTMPRRQRLAFANGLGMGFMVPALGGTLTGYYLAAGLPPLLAAALLFITPMSFLVSITRNSRLLVDRLALGFGLAIGPLLAFYSVQLDLLWTGVIGGTLAYLGHRLREALR